MRSRVFLSVFALLLTTSCGAVPESTEAGSGPQTYRQAKVELRDHVYHDRSDADFGTLYCGCSWDWTTRSGGDTNLDKGCDYQSEGNEYRAARIEYEHIVPAYMMGGERQCWEDEGRKHCATEDPVFGAMYTDMHNLTPSIGEVNAQRSNYPYGSVEGNESDYGGCATKFDERRKVLEPRDQAKGFVARVTFYMVDRYDLREEVLTPELEETLLQWVRRYPVSDWERERNRRIAKIQGNVNPFVTGDKEWEMGYQPSGEGIEVVNGRYQAAANDDNYEGGNPVIGNKNSDIYHLPEGCPSYSRVGEQNRVEFESAEAAEAAGYRKAGNCR